MSAAEVQQPSQKRACSVQLPCYTAPLHPLEWWGPVAAGSSGEMQTDAALSAAPSPLGSAIARLAQAQALREAELRHPSSGRPVSPGSSSIPIQTPQVQPDIRGGTPGSRRKRAQWFSASPHSSAQMAGAGVPADEAGQAGSSSPGTPGPKAALSPPEQEIAAETAALAAVHQSVDAAMDRAQTQLQASGGLRRLGSNEGQRLPCCQATALA